MSVFDYSGESEVEFVGVAAEAVEDGCVAGSGGDCGFGDQDYEAGGCRDGGVD